MATMASQEANSNVNGIVNGIVTGTVLECLARNILTSPCHEGAARDFSELDEEDQNQVWNDLTGEEAKHRYFHQGREVCDEETEPEPTQLVDESMFLLDQEFAKIPASQSAAFHTALQHHPAYVNDASFRLKFLRADRFDPQAAAVRMVKHFEVKRRIFGDALLGREIEMSDLDEDDLHALNSGSFQVLKDVDHSGRHVLFYYKALSNCYRKRDNIIRAFWYVTNVISLDESVQKLGLVNVVYNCGGYPINGMDYEKSRRLARAMEAIPVRFDSFFVCCDDGPWLNVVEAFSFMVTKFLRVRMRIIVGSHQECIYKLMALGIPYFSMPVNDQSELSVTDHSLFINHQREQELQLRQMHEELERQRQEVTAVAIAATDMDTYNTTNNTQQTTEAITDMDHDDNHDTKEMDLGAATVGRYMGCKPSRFVG